MTIQRIIVWLFFGIIVGGCTHTPTINNPLGSTPASPTVADLITHIQCEIWTIKNAADTPADSDAKAKLGRLTQYEYVAFATLTVDVTNLEGTSPSLSFITPYLTPMTNLTKSIGGQYSGTQHRNITESFTISIYDDQSGATKCADYSNKGHYLYGDLELGTVIRAGLRNVDVADFVFGRPKNTDNTKLSSIAAPVFGSTVDFTIVYGINNVGPTWTITHFKGPGGGGGGGGAGGGASGAGGAGGGSGGGGSQGLLTLTHTEKDTLVISFAPACPAGKDCDVKPAAVAPAAFDLEAEDNVSQIKQQLSSLTLREEATPAERSNYTAAQALMRTTLAATQVLNEVTRQSNTLAHQQAEAKPSSAESAAKAAQDNNTRMILQNLITSQ
jgi:uncharacterized membrane protein YgcG